MRLRLAFYAAQVLDLATFLFIVRLAGIGGEGNPLVAGVYAASGPAGIGLMKAGVIGLVMVSHRRAILVWGLAVVLIGFVLNVLSIGVVLR
jgi:hypothetical protein